MTDRRAAVSFAPVLALMLAASPGCSSSEPSARVTALLGGAESVSVLRDGSSAVRREAFRIDGAGHRDDGHRDAGHRDGASDGFRIHGWPVLAGPVDVDAATAASLADVLLADGTYEWDMSKACEFTPGLAIRETRGTLSVDVLVCFSCDEVGIWTNGTRRGTEDMDSRRADLVAIARKLFPGDAKFKALK
ncbi:MAG: hypothetical protein HMLKMBBP_01834 [Planctomycetes bacterium]|nr:hypothetical protein [Planctomycetota bacterium]